MYICVTTLICLQNSGVDTQIYPIDRVKSIRLTHSQNNSIYMRSLREFQSSHGKMFCPSRNLAWCDLLCRSHRCHQKCHNPKLLNQS